MVARATPSKERMASAVRKIELVLGISGEGEEQINVLVHALAAVSAHQRLDMAGVMYALTDSYLNNVMQMDEDEDEDDGEDYYD
jgi:hypothetical protein